MLSDPSSADAIYAAKEDRLNAPYGARCFLTRDAFERYNVVGFCLNAPYGARCFLTRDQELMSTKTAAVLMHLMALGAF